MAAKLRDVIGGLARPHRKIPGQLRPERSFQCQILTRHRHAGVGESRTRERDMITHGLGPTLVRFFALFFPRARPREERRIIRHHLQREVMIADHELVAGQCVECVFQLLGLRDRKVPGVHHPIELALQECLPRPLGQEGEGLGEYEGKRHREQLIKHADVCGRRVFLDARASRPPVCRPVSDTPTLRSRRKRGRC